jgi:hypothetical protein
MAGQRSYCRTWYLNIVVSDGITVAKVSKVDRVDAIIDEIA